MQATLLRAIDDASHAEVAQLLNLGASVHAACRDVADTPVRDGDGPMAQLDTPLFRAA